MTSQKHLKAAVRARMARTGERYTTARRHLTGEPPRPPAGRRAGLPTRSAAGGTTTAACSPTCWRPRASRRRARRRAPRRADGRRPRRRHRLHVLLVLLRRPAPDDDDRAAHPPAAVPARRPRAQPASPHRIDETTSAAKAARELDAALDAGRAPICTVDRPALGYHRVPGPQYAGADAYDVAVVGRRGDVVLLDDELPGADRGRRATTFAAARAGAPEEQAPHGRRRARRRRPVDLAPADPRGARGHRARPHRGRDAGQLRRQLRAARPGEVGPRGRRPPHEDRLVRALFDSSRRACVARCNGSTTASPRSTPRPGRCARCTRTSWTERRRAARRHRRFPGGGRPATPGPGSCGSQIAEAAHGRGDGPLPRAGRAAAGAAARRRAAGGHRSLRARRRGGAGVHRGPRHLPEERPRRGSWTPSPSSPPRWCRWSGRRAPSLAEAARAGIV